MITDESYSIDDLKEHILKKLSGQIWRSEGLDRADVIETAIYQTLLMYSRKSPRLVYEKIGPQTSRYQVETKKVLGVMRVDFVDGNTGFFQSTYQLNNNLLGVSSIQLAGGKVGELADFMQWRKMFQRVTSYAPDWLYNPEENLILIHNPAGYMACAVLMCGRTFDQVRLNAKDWFARMSVAQAKLQLGEYRSKFASIPGPGGKDVQLNGSALVSQANTEIEKLTVELNNFRMRIPIMID